MLSQRSRPEHADAAGIRHACRGAGVPPGAIDALPARFCIRQAKKLLPFQN
jgi:hypothetical protein